MIPEFAKHAEHVFSTRDDARSANCVRYSPKLRKYELVVDGQVKASISRFGMTVPACRTKFFDQVHAAAAGKRSDALVERLFPDKAKEAVCTTSLSEQPSSSL